jgi:hypothetical protein
MPKQSIRHLRATELKLLQERTKLQRRVEEALSGPGWAPERVHDLDVQQKELEAELASVRAEMRRLDREEPSADGE